MMVMGDSNAIDGAPETEGTGHLPVMLAPVLGQLDAARGGHYLDGTFGGGGHSRAILESNPENRVDGIDRDPEAVGRASRFDERYPKRFRFFRGEFSNTLATLTDFYDGILLDLGVSSFQLDDPERGFSFRADAPLDMRMDYASGVPASTFLETSAEAELIEAVRDFGEEPSWRRVVRAIMAARGTGRLETTGAFAAMLESVLGGRAPRGRRPIHPATRTFQGIRIAVNDELRSIERALPLAFDRLKPNGRLVVISFHSLEDRIVKRFCRRMAGRPEHGNDSRFQEDRTVLGELPFSKPILPDGAEIERNPRSRSARLRAIQKLHPDAL